MAYERINWQNKPSEATALNNVNLNKMDSAIYELDGKATTTETAITNLQDGKVDKVTGQGLSKTNDVQVTSSTNVGTKIATVQIFPSTGGVSGVQIKNGVVVDSALSSSSENPVQNKVVKSALGNKVDKVNGKGLSQVDNVKVTQHVAYGTVVSTIKTYGQDGTEVTSQVCNGVVVDSAMSSSSTNPVQNKVVASAIDDSVNWSRKTTSGTRILELTKKTTDGSSVNYDIYNGVVVDNAISSSSENPVQNKAIYDALNNLLPSKTVSGNPIAISDASGFNAKALKVTMNPIQDLHGYSNPWVGGAGKNKLPFDLAQIKTNNTSGTWSGNVYSYNGVTFTISDVGSVDVSGVPTSNYVVFVYSDFAGIDGEFRFNGCPSGGALSSIYKMDMIYNPNTGQTVADDIGQGSGAFELTSSRNYRARIIIYNSKPSGTITFKPMIRLSTETDATFAPYSNICPISGRTEASVTRTGKNLFDKSTSVDGYRLDSTGQPFPDGSFSISDYIKVLPNTNYVKNEPISINIPFCFYDLEKNFIVRYTSGNYVVSPSNACYMRLAFIPTDKDTLQVEIGSTATAYEPYTAETHTKEFGQTVYGGTLETDTGLLTITHAIKNLGELTWTKNEHQTLGTYFYATVASLGIKYEGEFISPYHAITTEYKVAGRTPTLFLNNTFCLDGSPNDVSQVQIKDDRYSDATTFKNGLTTDSVQLCYELATPIIIQLSPEAVTLLKGLNIISTDGDNIEMKYSVSLDSLLPTTTRTLAKSPIVEEPKEETDETEEQR